MYLSQGHSLRQNNDHVLTEPRELIESYCAVVHELKQQYTLVRTFQRSLSYLCQMNEELATSIQEMGNRAPAPLHTQRKELVAQAEHHLIYLEQLEGYVMQQRAQLEHIREVLQRVEADIATQEHILQALQKRVQLLDASE